MMQRRCAGSSHGNMQVGAACSCGRYHSQTNSFSMLLSMSKTAFDDEEQIYSFTTSPPPVDCTLSLGTPSTRLTDHHQHKKPSSCISNFGWNVLPSKHASPPSASKNHRAGTNTNGGDPLLARRCANCDTTSTPLWRNGPRGPKSLCNACGIRFKKEERRATAVASGSNGTVETQHMMNNSYRIQPQKMGCYSSTTAYGNELIRFIGDEEDSAGDARFPFLSWRFDSRPSHLVHHFTTS